MPHRSKQVTESDAPFGPSQASVCLVMKMSPSSGMRTARDTLSRCVSSCSALYCATTAFRISLPMEGSTRSSQSMPRLLNIWDSRCVSGFDSTLREMFTICKSAAYKNAHECATLCNTPCAPG